MKRRTRLDIARWIPPALLAGALATGVWLVLGVIARPANFGPRTDVLTARLQTLSPRMKAPTATLAFSPDAVCHDDLDQAAFALRARLQSLGNTSGVSVVNVSVNPADVGQGGVTLESIGVSFDATGRYDQVLGLLDALAAAKPTLFTDAVDLRSQVTAVSLKFRGRVFCSART